MNIGILGCGAFGLALAHILNRNGCSIDMWTHNEEERKELDKKRVSSKLKDYKIPKDIKVNITPDNLIRITIIFLKILLYI